MSQPPTIQDHPDPQTLYPIEGVTRTFFLKNKINHPQIFIGDYTYYDDPHDPDSFERNVLYLFDFMKDNLIIGKFCQLATGVRFIMNGANHAMNGISTYPFKVFGKSWAWASMDVVSKGDTIIENDVWIGNSVTIMQGLKIGSGAIIATQSLVTKNVGPYEIWGGNPAGFIRKRFDQDTIDFLLELAWWDWPVDKITLHLNAITSGDIISLQTLV
ncbi:MAG: CatB-related O-acetyltransferase [Janthinobacterium lividum]